MRTRYLLVDGDGSSEKGTYGVGSSVVDSARRREASLIRLSRSLSLGTTCLDTIILSNSFCPSHVSIVLIYHFVKTYLALLAKLINHLSLNLPQHTLRPLRNRRITAGNIVPSNLPQSLLERSRVEFLQTRCAGTRRNGCVSRGEGR
jgi:hypothetical protein